MAQWEFYERHFSSSRLRHYLAATANDQTRAAELYRWNTSLSTAFWDSLAYLEVALRNAIEAELTARNSRLKRNDHWIFDETGELGRDLSGQGEHRQPYKDLAEAAARVRRNGKRLDAGQVVSETSFGVWHQLVSKKHMNLWPDLVNAFPHSTGRDQALVREPVANLRDLRNRIGHHHRIWSVPVQDRYDELLLVAGFIDPLLATFISERSQVPRLLVSRP